MKNLTEWAVQLAGRVDSFLKQRTIVALLMLYEGVMLLVQSGNTTRGMAMGIAIAVALAAGGIIAEALAQRGGKRKRSFRRSWPLAWPHTSIFSQTFSRASCGT